MMMAVKSQEQRLMEALMDQEVLVLKGYHFDIADDVGVIVSCRGHVRGFWRYQSGRFAWTPAGYYEATTHANTADDAVTQVLSLAAKSS